MRSNVRCWALSVSARVSVRKTNDMLAADHNMRYLGIVRPPEDISVPRDPENNLALIMKSGTIVNYLAD